jgi:hypothetical protein
MDTVLDLDLDFFVWPTVHYPERKRAPKGKFTHVATEAEVRSFLEERCHLNKDVKVAGRQFVEHEEAFRVWQAWVREGKLTNPFDVIHIDAHADLGAGLNSTCRYIETKLLAVPLSERHSPRFGSDGINSGNYLLAVIANRLIRQLTYVYPTDPAPPYKRKGNPQLVEIGNLLSGNVESEFENRVQRETARCCFQNHDFSKIQLAHRSIESFRQNGAIMSLEPHVRFEMISDSDFKFSGFTHMVVAESPQYAPKSANGLLRVIQDYFDPT